MSKVRVGICGLGRIGRITFRTMLERPEIEVVAFNITGSVEGLVQLLKYDSVHGRFNGEVKALSEEQISVNGKIIQVYKERDIADIPWGKHDIDVVVEATGAFRKRELISKHLQAGAKRVVLTAPANKAEDSDATVVMGVNDNILTPDMKIISNASCTTNCLAPMAKVLHEKFGIKRGLMTTVHAYTNDQNILDVPHKDMRRARACAVSIIPTSTGAAKAVGLVLPDLKGKMDGFAMRVPTPDGSVVDLTAELEKNATAEEINAAMKEAAETYMKGYIEYCTDPIVSIDIVGNPISCIFDSLLTKVLDNNFVKVVGWYDNEFGYSHRVVDLVIKVGMLK